MIPNKNLLSLLLALAVLPPAVAAQDAVPRPLAGQAAADYARQARYPQWSSVLEAGAADPLLDDRVPTRQSRLGPGGAGPRLTVWASTISALPGEAVTLYAALTAVPGKPSLLESAPLPGSAVTGAALTGALSGLQLGELGVVAYRDDGKSPDVLADDGLYTAVYTLPPTRAPALGTADSVMVVVTATLDDGELRKAAGGFQFSHPAARLTGRFVDSLRDGNLVIGAEVQALAPGRVHLAGTIADASGLPVASAQAARVLAAGTQWVELSFYGLAFHDRGVSGALSLSSVSLASTGGMPNALGPVIAGAHRTRPYTLAQFTSAPFNDPALLEQARRLDVAPAATPSVK